MKINFNDDMEQDVPVVKPISNAAKLTSPSIKLIDEPFVDDTFFTFSANTKPSPQMPSMFFNEESIQPSNYVQSFDFPIVGNEDISIKSAIIRMQEEKIEELEYRLEAALNQNAELITKLGKELIDKMVSKPAKFDLNKIKWD